ncbi:hypothetical protein Vafri_16057 [Volvox africanus]|uniref:Cyclic nucleotide-binding domain-containing protein n=1 Tax=Volvox africanus TaxID=51714 RepID=A0A8J4BH66_9CHLO|nr:hypothetical protein Vafri_16057 [Volvox africanus]
MELGPKDLLCRQGDPADCMWAVVNGRCYVVIDPNWSPAANRPPETDPKKTTQVAAVQSGQLFGEMCVFGNVRHRTATLRCATDVLFYRLKRLHFLRVCPPAQLEELRAIAEAKMMLLVQAQREEQGAAARINRVLRGHSLRALHPKHRAQLLRGSVDHLRGPPSPSGRLQPLSPTAKASLHSPAGGGATSATELGAIHSGGGSGTASGEGDIMSDVETPKPRDRNSSSVLDLDADVSHSPWATISVAAAEFVRPSQQRAMTPQMPAAVAAGTGLGARLETVLSHFSHVELVDGLGNSDDEDHGNGGGGGGGGGGGARGAAAGGGGGGGSGVTSASASSHRLPPSAPAVPAPTTVAALPFGWGYTFLRAVESGSGPGVAAGRPSEAGGGARGSGGGSEGRLGSSKAQVAVQVSGAKSSASAPPLAAAPSGAPGVSESAVTLAAAGASSLLSESKGDGPSRFLSSAAPMHHQTSTGAGDGNSNCTGGAKAVGMGSGAAGGAASAPPSVLVASSDADGGGQSRPRGTEGKGNDNAAGAGSDSDSGGSGSENNEAQYSYHGDADAADAADADTSDATQQLLKHVPLQLLPLVDCSWNFGPCSVLNVLYARSSNSGAVAAAGGGGGSGGSGNASSRMRPSLRGGAIANANGGWDGRRTAGGDGGASPDAGAGGADGMGAYLPLEPGLVSVPHLVIGRCSTPDTLGPWSARERVTEAAAAAPPLPLPAPFGSPDSVSPAVGGSSSDLTKTKSGYAFGGGFGNVAAAVAAAAAGGGVRASSNTAGSGLAPLPPAISTAGVRARAVPDQQQQPPPPHKPYGGTRRCGPPGPTMGGPHSSLFRIMRAPSEVRCCVVLRL